MFQNFEKSPTLFCLCVDFPENRHENIYEIEPALINEIEIASVIYAEDHLSKSQSEQGKINQTFCHRNG